MRSAELVFVRRGKVRDLYRWGDELWLVASDRISAYDVVLESEIPEKGKILTQLSRFWFELLSHICPHHVLSYDLPEEFKFEKPDWEGRLMRCRETAVIPMECVVRGYLAGSAWEEYRQKGTVGGYIMPKGLREAEKLPEPLFTPARKNPYGHDENLNEQEAREWVGEKLFEKLREISISLYKAAARHSAERGLILADTKFEFGMLEGQVVWIDEALTPDSSRYWDRDSYIPGQAPKSFDKQHIREYLKKLKNWHGNPVPLPEEVIEGTRKRYECAWLKITGRMWRRQE
ncbi:MAG: phosphoribosylaminoimidazolesuccinocarboxamide synthase [Methylacidiphilales bacterium]|nr:phosphoribosylaminoimidazolesuccinocarboxamide synthase [Candidatus Methylacidiphilales bacterium]MDW8349006.1 phosphoribosylaminoimidazolesuccinocarboxamide synthase [Verrucomicrobiae bacterium]